jgi:hypothetical protein
MSTNLNSPNNNKSVLKHSNRAGDPGISNGIEQIGIFPTQPSKALTTFKGPKKLQVSSAPGLGDTIATRPAMFTDNNEIFQFKFNSESECKTNNGGLFIAEHDYWVDSIKFRQNTINVAALTATLYKANSGAVFSAGTATAITATMDLASAANTVATGAILSETAKYVSKGQTVGLVFNGTPDQASGVIFSIKARRVIPGTRTENYIE